MADPQTYRPAPGEVPTKPGVYRFVDDEGRVLYVGKAKNLRNRLANYFQPEENLLPRTRSMVNDACRVEWTVVATEIEALTLEYLWIKEYEPRYNVVFRDNKSYPYLAVSLRDEYPRVWVTRAKHRKGNRYFGPYAKVWAIRQTLDNLLAAFPMRSCSNGVFKQAQRSGRPCLNGYIDRCTAPCVGTITPEEHREIAEALTRFMDGDAASAIKERTRLMKEAAASQDYERAARLRDQIAALTTVNEQNTVVFDSNLDADIFGIASDEIEASVQVFYVRGGRIRGQRGWVSEEIGGFDHGELLEELLVQVYGDPTYDDAPSALEVSTSVDDRAHTPLGAIPSQIWIPATLPATSQAPLEAWLAERRGGVVRLKNPKRGDKAKLAQTVTENAKLALQRHKLERAGDITVRSQALEELRLALDLPRAPLRIECYDISHTAGQEQVGSMVVFEDGLAKKADYRRFVVHGTGGQGASDDTAAMSEVLTRRLARIEERGLPEEGAGSGEIDETTGKPRRFAYKPDLLVVDGGLPQVNAAWRVIEETGADVRVIGLAKRLEEVWLPGA
ncbi:MAG: excinuclease ABC subunit UvrC, partial [Actinomycetaceae bacterium]|nr:excinuclease ABC subunit UvrC [Actinomycetaceae bacterium]